MTGGHVTLEKINCTVEQDMHGLVREEEQRYCAAVSAVVDRIESDRGTEIVLLAGPSASGKTTTAAMVAQALERRGHAAYAVSLDDFFRPQNCCVDSEGERDFESVHALDIPLLQRTFEQLLRTHTCEIPRFNFATGDRSKEVRRLNIADGDVVIVEGIHALNPVITDSFPADHLLKLYVNVSSRIYGAEDEVVLSKRDLRFIRRMIRDYHYRSSTVSNTFMLWDGVMHGEDAYLFPFRYRADIRLNSFHAYEPCIFRDEAINLLRQVSTGSPYYAKAQSLIANMSRFFPADSGIIPSNSLLREFLS